MTLPVVLRYESYARSGGTEIFQWMNERAWEGWEVKAVVQNPQATQWVVVLQRPAQIIDGSDGWTYPKFVQSEGEGA